MSFKNQSVFSSTYTNTTFTVTEGMGISSITINLVSGSATLLGGLGIPGLTNSSVALTAGQPVVLNVSSGYTLEGVTVDSTAGGVFQVFTIYDYINSPDPSATAFFAATGITGAVQSAAIDTLVKSLKAYNLWPYMKAVYPFVTDNRNLLGYTEDFGNAAWIKTGSVITANTTTAPNGTLTADTLQENTSTSEHYIRTLLNGLSASQTYTYSNYVKYNNRRYILITVYYNGGSFPVYTATFDILNGVFVSQSASNGATIIGASITADNDGWYRISVSGQVGAFTNTIACQTNLLNDSLVQSYLGTAKSAYIWGAQMELGSTATTYQPIATTQQAYISNQFKYNLVNPVDSDAAFRLVFNGGWTFSTNGALPNGTNGFANTYFTPSSVLTLNSTHISTYLRTNSTGLFCDISVIQDGVSGAVNQLNIYPRYLEESYYRVFDDSTAAGANTNSQGFYIANRVSSTQTRNFKNSALIVKTATSGVINTSNIILGAGGNALGNPAAFSNRQQAFASIGNGLTDAQAINFAIILYAYQTALSRQVGVPVVSDPDAQAFINAADITDLTQANAINNLVIGLKADGLWTKMKAIYPFVGGTASTHKWNLKDPRDLDAAYRLVFNGGWTHSSTGATPNGTNGYADTRFIPNTALTLNSGHLSFYSRTNNTTGIDDFSTVITGDTQNMRILINSVGSLITDLNSINQRITVANADSLGFYQVSRTSSTSLKVYKNAITFGTNTSTNTGTQPITSMYLGAANRLGNPINYSNRQCAFASLADGLTDTEAANLYTRVQAFQNSLNRAVI